MVKSPQKHDEASRLELNEEEDAASPVSQVTDSDITSCTSFEVESSIDGEGQCISSTGLIKNRIVSMLMASFHQSYQIQSTPSIKLLDTMPFSVRGSTGDTNETSTTESIRSPSKASELSSESSLSQSSSLAFGEEGHKDGTGKLKVDLAKPGHTDTGRKFACPFHKHDPTRYSSKGTAGKFYRVCSGPGFSTIDRVKSVFGSFAILAVLAYFVQGAPSTMSQRTAQVYPLSGEL